MAIQRFAKSVSDITFNSGMAGVETMLLAPAVQERLLNTITFIIAHNAVAYDLNACPNQPPEVGRIYYNLNSVL